MADGGSSLNSEILDSDLLAAEATSLFGPTVSTDKDDYAPGEIVTITATGFEVGSSIEFAIADDPLDPGDDGDADVYTPFVVIDGGVGDLDGIANGQVVKEWLVPTDDDGSGTGTPDAYNATLNLTATGSDGLVATTSFTDAIQITYNQWSNFSSPEWQNGALNANQNRYLENEYKPHVLGASGVVEGTTYVLWVAYDYSIEQNNGNYFGGFDFFDEWDKTDFSPNTNPDPFPNPPGVDNLPINPSTPTFENGGSLDAWNATILEIGTPIIYSGDGIDGAADQTQRAVGIVFTPDDGDGTAGEVIDVNLYWSLHIAPPDAVGPGAGGASEWPGASLRTILDVDAGDSLSINPDGSAGAFDPNGGLSMIDPTWENVSTGAVARSLDTKGIVRGLISGYKWGDTDGDGVWDADEFGLADWEINLTGTSQASGEIVNLTVFTSDGSTDANGDGAIDEKDVGYYEFSPLDRSTADGYTISEVLQPGWTQTYPATPNSYNLILTQDNFEFIGEFGVAETPNFGNQLIGVPEIQIIKTAGTAADGMTLVTEAGDVVYSYAVTNTGNIDLNNISVVDDAGTPGDDSDDITVGTIANLAAGASETLAATINVTDDTTNVATVTGSSPAGTTVSDDDDAVVDIVTPGIQVIKTAATTPDGETLVTEAGDVVYSYEVTNTGETELTNIVVVDDAGTAGDTSDDITVGMIASLASGASQTLNTTINVTADTTNVATVTGDSPAGTTVSDDDDAVVDIVTPGIQVIKTAATTLDGETLVTEAGDVVYSYEVTNTGETELTNIVVVDDAGTAGDTSDDITVGTIASLAFGASQTLNTTINVTADTTNVATVTGDSPAGTTVSDDDDAVVDIVAPAISLEKTGTFQDENGDTFAQVGETIDYTFTIENTGEVVLNNVVVEDPNVTVNVGTFDGILDPGEIVELSGTYAVTQDDIDAGLKDNNALASGDSPAGVTVDDPGDHSEPLPQNPVIAIEKTGTFDAGEDGFADVGELITYNFEITNEGNVSLSNVTVTDPLLGLSDITFVNGDTDGDNQLDVDETWNYSATYAVTQEDIDAGNVANLATADSDESDPDSDDHDEPLPQNPVIDIVKTGTFDAGGDGFADVGELITYNFEVTNEGNVSLSNVTVTDPLPGLSAISFVDGDTDGDNELDVDETWNYSATYAVTQADIDAGNVANLATADSDESDSDDDDHDEPLPQNPVIEIAKTGTFDAGADGFADVGELITYNFEVTNGGNISLSNVTVTDPLPGLSTITFDGGDTDGDSELDVDETWTYSATYAVTQADIDAGNVVNLATADSDESDPDDDDHEEPLPQNPVISINKVTNGADGQNILVGSDITWTYSITNDGNVTLNDVTLVDDQLGPVTNLVSNGNGDTALDVGETWVYEASGTAVEGDYSNLGSVTGAYTDSDGNSLTVSDEDPSSYFGAAPAIAIDKVTNGADGQNILEGTPITWSYTVTNVGNVALSNVSVDDDQLAGADDPTFNQEISGNGDTIFDAGEIWEFTATGTAGVGDYSNIGTASGDFTDDLGNTESVEASDDSSYIGVSTSGQITPTGTTCDDYISGTATNFEDFYAFQGGVIQYNDKKNTPGVINSVNPGALFYYTGGGGDFAADADDDGVLDSFTVNIDQTNSENRDDLLFGISNSGVKLFGITDVNGNGVIDSGDTCQQIQLHNSNSDVSIINGDIDVTFNPDNVAANGIEWYVLSVNYQPSAIKGADTANNTLAFDTNFVTNFNGVLETDLGGVSTEYKFA